MSTSGLWIVIQSEFKKLPHVLLLEQLNHAALAIASFSRRVSGNLVANKPATDRVEHLIFSQQNGSSRSAARRHAFPRRNGPPSGASFTPVWGDMKNTRLGIDGTSSMSVCGGVGEGAASLRGKLCFQI